jgi:hypothetical protein
LRGNKFPWDCLSCIARRSLSPGLRRQGRRLDDQYLAISQMMEAHRYVRAALTRLRGFAAQKIIFVT